MQLDLTQCNQFCGRAQLAAVAPGVGVGLCHTRRVDSRLRMQAQVLAACKAGAAHFLVALASLLAFMACTDATASASSRTSASICSCNVRCVDVIIIAAVATVAIAAAGVGCIIFLKELTTADQTTYPNNIKGKS